MATLHVLRVFIAANGEHGNPLGVFLGGAEVPAERRQAVAADLGFSETVFVDESERGEMRIFTPAEEIPFAGHPSVGTAWLLAREGSPVTSLRPPAGEVPVRREDELTWIGGRPQWASSFWLEQLGSPAEVDALDPAAFRGDGAYCWAWENEEEGRVRSRAFFPSFGIVEDEATGAAAVALCGRLRRPLGIRQGRGSQLLARPLRGGMVEVGGRCVLDEVREYELVAG
ncbi:MAG TPA: PhzF family phenazine biosynthesis protein [Solirubrobacterales bacterium]|jgi:predicted PhzF superfamily epimerase YddE/YHI9|nr:PhzF family phenazine biosynthesis protein [Solirubrobacterales bacterium]